MEDELEAHVFTAGLNVMATPKLSLFLNGYYVDTQEDYDDPTAFKDYLRRLTLGGRPLFDPDIWNETSDYSDLDMQEFKITGGFTYSFSENLALQLKATYADYDQDEYYMQDEDGSAFYTYAGLKWKF